MKLSKTQVKLHHQAEEILQQDSLSFDERLFVLEHWHEGAENINSFAGAFFTPLGLAQDFASCIEVQSTVIDLCAGIGKLAFYAHFFGDCTVTCVELNPDYARVGKKILPEATWVNSSVMDKCLTELPPFDYAISNPPFGKIKSGVIERALRYKGSEFEFIVIDIASELAKQGLFILPQTSTPYQFSASPEMKRKSIAKVEKFTTETGLEMELNACIDTSLYLNDWNGVSPLCEVVDIDFRITTGN